MSGTILAAGSAPANSTVGVGLAFSGLGGRQRRPGTGHSGGRHESTRLKSAGGLQTQLEGPGELPLKERFLLTLAGGPVGANVVWGGKRYPRGRFVAEVKRGWLGHRGEGREAGQRGWTGSKALIGRVRLASWLRILILSFKSSQ